jgi:hypothetical protein
MLKPPQIINKSNPQILVTKKCFDQDLFALRILVTSNEESKTAGKTDTLTDSGTVAPEKLS